MSRFLYICALIEDSTCLQTQHVCSEESVKSLIKDILMSKKGEKGVQNTRIEFII